jgi:hypothetical protein
MKPIIISYDCTDHDPIEQWVPNDPFDVDIWINFTIGPNSKSGDNFLARVITSNNLHGKDSDKYAVILTEYSWANVIYEINRFLEMCSGNNWLEISEKLSKFMHWEYQDYKP